MYQSFHYKPKFDELDIRLDNIISTIGYTDGNIPDGYNKILNELFDSAKEIVTPECGFVLLPQNSSSSSNGIVTLDGVDFKTENIVAGPLKKMSGAALFLSTIGPEFDKWSKSTFANSVNDANNNKAILCHIFKVLQ